MTDAAGGRFGANQATGSEAAYRQRMFVFFSNRAGCLGSVLISLIGTGVLILVMYACSTGLGG